MSDLSTVELEVVRRLRESAHPDAIGRIDAVVAEVAPVLADVDARVVAERVRARVGGLGPLQPLCDDPTVTDVLVSGPGPVWIERAGRLERTSVEVSADELALVVERMLGPLGLRLDRTNAIVDARLPDGSRVSVVGPPLAVDGVVLTIRRFAATTLPLRAFGPPEVASLLAEVVDRRLNVVVYGPTGSGKTTLLGAMAALLPDGERVLTIEDVAELRLPGSHVVRLEARPANAEGAGEVTIRQLVRAALRLRPDRIVVGEVRGPEAFDMVWAMATGHDGSMSTCHADGPLDALARLETFATSAPGVDLPLAAARRQLRSAVDVLVGVARAPGGGRTVVSIAECGTPDGNELRHLLVEGRVVDRPRRDRRRTAT
jgi:pilus assembly protein CpaF